MAAGTAPPSRERSANATLWALADLAGGQGASFLIFLVLARVIGPAQYGVFAIAMSLIGLLTIVQYYGFADAIVQRARVDDSFLDTVFWCDLILALGIMAIAQVAAHPVAVLFGEPVVEPIVRTLSVLSLLQALVTVPTALCRRALHMRVLAMRTLVSYAVGGMVGISLALHGYGVWALVSSPIAQCAVSLIVMYWRFPWRPGWRPRFVAWQELFRFAGHFMLANAMKLSIDRISALIVGLFVSATGVGWYSLSLRIMFTASTVAMNPIERVALPVLSRYLDDLPGFRETYRRMVLVVNSVWTPLATALGVSAPALVPFLFGERWAPAGRVLQVMCLSAPTLGLWFLNGQALAALGKPERFTRLVLIYVALACVVFPFAAWLGIVWAGGAWAVLSLLMVPLHLRAIERACGLSLRPILSDWLRVVVSAALMLMVILAITARLGQGIMPMAVGLAASGVAYLLALQFVLLPGYVGRMLNLLRDAAGADRPGTREGVI